MGRSQIFILVSSLFMGTLYTAPFANAGEIAIRKEAETIWLQRQYPTVVQEGKGDFKSKYHPLEKLVGSNAELPKPIEPPIVKQHSSDFNDTSTTETQLSIGLDYLSEWERTKNEKIAEKAIYWIRMAANGGNARAMTILGSFYQAGKIVSKNYKRAFSWYKKAAELGNATAQSGIGIMYLQGTGVLQDYKKALYWCEKSAKKGNVSAQFCLGIIYFEGKGVNINLKKAAYWYRKAAENGMTVAMGRLAIMYFAGLGVKQDYVTAYALTNIASSLEEDQDEMAKLIAIRNEIIEKMTPSQVAYAQSLSANWKPGQPLPLP